MACFCCFVDNRIQFFQSVDSSVVFTCLDQCKRLYNPRCDLLSCCFSLLAAFKTRLAGRVVACLNCAMGVLLPGSRIHVDSTR